MSIEQTLERIAVGIEKLIEMQGVTISALADPVAAPAPAPVVTQLPTGPGPAAMPQIQTPGPVVTPPTNVASFPQQAAPMPGPSGIGPGQAMPPVAAPAPMAQPVALGDPAANTGLLDQIRDAANQFHRAHPERAGEVWQILSAIGAQKIDAIPPQSQAQVLAQIKALGA